MVLLGFNGGRGWPGMAVDLLAGIQHLYYLPVLVQLVVLFVVLRWSGLDRWGFALAAVTSLGVYVYSDAVLWTQGEPAGFLEGDLRRLFLPWAVFFFFGVRNANAATPFMPSPRGFIWLAVGTCAAWTAYEWGLQMEEAAYRCAPRTEILLEGLPFQFCAAWLFLAGMTAWHRSGRAARLLAQLAAKGPDMYGVYLVHFPLLILLYSGWIKIGRSTMYWLEVPVFWLLAWIGSLALVRGIRAIGSRGLCLLFLGEDQAYKRIPATAMATNTSLGLDAACAITVSDCCLLASDAIRPIASLAEGSKERCGFWTRISSRLRQPRTAQNRAVQDFVMPPLAAVTSLPGHLFGRLCLELLPSGLRAPGASAGPLYSVRQRT